MDKQIVKNPSHIKVNGEKIKVVNSIKEAVECLKKGEVIARYEAGDSMTPILRHMEYGVVYPIEKDVMLASGDAVLCEVKGYLMTHMVMMASESAYDGDKYLIGNTHMQFYGWTDKVYGVVQGTNVFEEECDYNEAG